MEHIPYSGFELRQLEFINVRALENVFAENYLAVVKSVFQTFSIFFLSER